MRHHQSLMEALEGTSRLPISHLRLVKSSKCTAACNWIICFPRRVALIHRSECLMCGVGVEAFDIALAERQWLSHRAEGTLFKTCLNSRAETMTLPFHTPKPFPKILGQSDSIQRVLPLLRGRPRSDAAADGGRGRPQRGGGAAAEVRRFPGGDG